MASGSGSMSNVFLLQNQHKQLLNKQGEWVDGREASTLYRTVHRDEALNHLVETNARDYTLRMKIIECSLSERGLPLLSDEDLPPLEVACEEAENPVSKEQAALETESVESTYSAPDSLSTSEQVVGQ